MSNVKQPICGDAVVYTPGEGELNPAFVCSQSAPAPGPTTAPADLLVFELDGTITPRVAVAFAPDSTTPNTWTWKKDAS